MFLHVGGSFATNTGVLGTDKDTPKDHTPTQERPRRRKWLKRLGVAALVLVVGLALFHRPIFFEATRYFILRAAKQQNLELSYEMRGSVFTTLSVINLKAVPTEPGPIKRLEISTLNLRYSLWDLITDGMPAFLQELDMRNVFVELTPADPLPADKEETRQAFKFPALFPALLNLENVNVLIHAHTGDTVLEGLFFSLLPDRAGALKIQTLNIPGVRRWTDITAATSYTERHLVLADLFVGQEIVLREFQLDVSNLEKEELGLMLEGTFFDAPVRLTAQVTDLNATNHLVLNLKSEGLVFEPVWKYLNLTVPLQGELERVEIVFEGDPTRPASWSGQVQAQLRQAALNGQALGDIKLQATMAEARVSLTVRDELDAKNLLTLTATAALPEKFKDFVNTRANGTVHLQAPEAALLRLPEPLAGDVKVKADFQLADGLLSAKATIDSAFLAVAGAELTGTQFSLALEKDLKAPADAPIFQALSTRWEGGIAEVRFQKYTADAVRLRLASRDAQVTIEELALAKQTNIVRVAADYILPVDGKAWDRQPLKFDLVVDAPDLSAFLAPGAAAELAGNLQITGRAEARDRIFNGNFSIVGSEIHAHGLPVRRVNAQVAVVENRLNFSRLDLVLNDHNRVQGHGEVRFDEGLAYGGELDVQLADLSLLQPLLGRGPNAPVVGGKLTVFWKGSGEGKNLKHSGTASLDLTGGRFGEQKNLSAHFNGSYAPDHINIPDFFLASDLATAGFSLFWKNNRLRVDNLTVQQKKHTLLEGKIDIPLHLAEVRNPARLIPADEPLSLVLKTRDLKLRPLFLQLDKKSPPLEGVINLDADLRGTLDKLDGKIAVRADGLQSPNAKQFAPASVELDLVMQNDRLSLDGTARQKLLEPLRISGNLPFDAAAILQARKLDPQTPVDLRISLPRSSLDFVASLVPAVRQSRGHATADIRVGGTIADPVLAGNVTADLAALRFTDPSLPPINAFALRVNFTGNQAVIERCAGGIAGGSFQVGGRMTFATLDNPVLDLRLTSKDALVLQNDDMTARVSSDLRATGPLNAASVTGNAWITRSRFFRNIDILPIGLPGRPAPQPPEDPPTISFRHPPLRDWKFDVAIRTSDPFLVQSNLATGRILVDLRLGGTGLAPWLEGTILVEQLTASLPFSRLNITGGQIFFTRQDPFVPQLNLRGTSTIRDYQVTVFITGPVTAPDALFTSDPPLPQTEVVSLIATGMTTKELTSDPNALAGRAAMLVFQRLYNSTFRRNQPPVQNESFLSRIQFDIGTIDPRTGRQSTTLGIPLSDRIMLTGGLDVGGNFRGQIKYLIRFK